MSEVKIKIDKIELIEISKLKPNKDNRNSHPESQITELSRHYRVHGMRTPLIVSKQSGNIVSGNGRYLAAKKAGLTHLPVSYQDFDTPELEYAFGIADNGLSLWSELDLSQINLDLEGLGPELNLADLGLKNFVLDISEKQFDPSDTIEQDKKDKRCPHCGEIL
jgi:ParB-like chromosome segregation protein Spo0J